jgi:hypothetical protein
LFAPDFWTPPGSGKTIALDELRPSIQNGEHKPLLGKRVRNASRLLNRGDMWCSASVALSECASQEIHLRERLDVSNSLSTNPNGSLTGFGPTVVPLC